jgi:hypothetical protein
MDADGGERRLKEHPARVSSSVEDGASCDKTRRDRGQRGFPKARNLAIAAWVEPGHSLPFTGGRVQPTRAWDRLALVQNYKTHPLWQVQSKLEFAPAHDQPALLAIYQTGDVVVGRQLCDPVVGR